MGFPFKPHPRETLVLSKHFGEAEARSLDGWKARGGYRALEQALGMDPVAIQNVVKESGLRGRGGAGFPTGLKWSFMKLGDGKPHYLCCNADESEPGTFKDREIMRWTPHALIEGCAIAAHAIGAETAYIYIRGEFTEPLERMERACAEARQAGVIGRNAMGTGKRVDVWVHKGAGAYICGEETGLLSSLEGDRGYPKIKPPFPAVEGAWRSPTLINNTQTIALLPGIVNMGADAWAKIGPERNSGPMIYCLSGHIKKPGLFELTMDVTLRELVEQCGGGVLNDLKPKAIIPGGSSMPVLRVDGQPYTNAKGEQVTDNYDIRMDYDTLKNANTLLGSAAVIVMHERTCMVSALYNLIRFYHHESCGQCTPCREGSGWLEKILARIVRGEGKTEDIDGLLSVAGQMSGTTICLLADSAAMPAGAFITKFREEFVHFCKEKKSMVENAIRL